jgi:hypothetical protein
MEVPFTGEGNNKWNTVKGNKKNLALSSILTQLMLY